MICKCVTLIAVQPLTLFALAVDKFKLKVTVQPSSQLMPQLLTFTLVSFIASSFGCPAFPFARRIGKIFDDDESESIQK